MTRVTADRDMIKSPFAHMLQKSPRLYRITRKVYSLFALRARFVPLSGNSLPDGILAQLRNDPGYHGIIDDLVAYTGFSAEELTPYLLRRPEKHFQSEFEWFSPKNERELTWFYRAGSAYLFGNAVHPYAPALDIIGEGTVLDFGAGAGCNTIGLAKRGIHVDFLEINSLQADFIRFRVERHNLKNVRGIAPYHDGKFDPISCITERYDAIAAMDVLEHIPDYRRFVAHFIERLNPGGLIIENSPFDPNAGQIAIHLRAPIPLEEAMAGMERMKRGVWRKPPISQAERGSPY